MYYNLHMASVLFICEKQVEKTPVVECVKNQFAAEIMNISEGNISNYLRTHPADIIGIYLKDVSVFSGQEIVRLLQKVKNSSVILIGSRQDCKFYYDKAGGAVKNCIFFPFALNDFLTSFAKIVNNDSSSNDIPYIFPTEMKRHILVVDDDPIFLRTMMNWLKESYNVSVVKSGFAAIDFLSKEIPDLVLLDYEMPEMNGLETLKKIRTTPKGPEIPVLFLTGVTDSEMVKDAVMLRPQGYILKNITQADLLVKLSEVTKVK